MTSQHDRSDAGGPEHTPRLRLKPKASTGGQVDGAWWPHSADLAGELPDLLAVLSVRLGVIDRVTFSVAEWPDAPARLVLGNRYIRLDGYRAQPANTIEIIGTGSARILLLVVPPRTDADQAHETMMAAAGPDNSSSADRLLDIDEEAGEVRGLTAVTEERWKAATDS